MDSAKKLIIITGSEGFIGKNLVLDLINYHQFEIIGNDINKQTIFSSNYKFIEGDLSDQNTLQNIFENVPLYNQYFIIHLAAQTSAQISMENPTLDLEINVNVLFKLLEHIESIQRLPNLFIFSSSMAVYGSAALPEGGFQETQDLSPCSVYGYTKSFAEKLLAIKDINYLNLRLFNIYGPMQNLENKKQGMISIYLESLINNNEILIKGSLERTRDHVYIKDLVYFLRDVIMEYKKYNELIFKFRNFNFCSGIETNVGQLTKLMVDLYYKKTGINARRTLLKPTAGDMNFSYGNNKSLLNAFGLRSFTPLEKGISCMMDWALEVKYE